MRLGFNHKQSEIHSGKLNKHWLIDTTTTEQNLDFDSWGIFENLISLKQSQLIHFLSAPQINIQNLCRIELDVPAFTQRMMMNANAEL